jgi:drug/metabolite transporter (DMT)-like permease
MPTHGAQRIKADLTLLSAALIWGLAFVAQRVAAENAPVFLFNGVRFLLGALVLLPFAWLEKYRSPGAPVEKNAAAGILLAGLLLFGATSFQQLGLRYTTAGNAGFITGLYVVLVPILLAVGGKQRLRSSLWTAALLASMGLFLLSTGGRLRLALGDALELVGAALFALHVIWIAWIVQRVPILPLAIGQYLLTALLSLGIGFLTESGLLAVIQAAWIPIVYTGIFSIGLGYTLQAFGQRTAPPADATILLSMEAPLAALFGWLILEEALGMVQLAGCALMLAGMLLAQIPVMLSASKSGI